MRKLIVPMLGLSLGFNAAVGVLYWEQRTEIMRTRQAFWSLRAEYDRVLKADRFDKSLQDRQDQLDATLQERLAKLLQHRR